MIEYAKGRKVLSIPRISDQRMYAEKVRVNYDGIPKDAFYNGHDPVLFVPEINGLTEIVFDPQKLQMSDDPTDLTLPEGSFTEEHIPKFIEGGKENPIYNQYSKILFQKPIKNI